MAGQMIPSGEKKPSKKKDYEYDIGCVPSHFWYHIVGENILVTLIALFTRIKVKPDKDYLNEEGPIIVLANHQSYLDPMVISKLTRGRPGNFVTGEFVFRNNPWGHWFKLGGAIPKKQFVVDTVAVKAMMKVLKRKGVLFIFPEATRSVDGSSITFDDGVAKMAKKTGAAIYIAHIHGAYLTMPRWGKGIRKGKITAEFVRKLPASRTKELSEEHLQEFILDGIKYDENDYARQNNPVHKSRKLAAGMENIAYVCPRCEKEFKMRWAGKGEGDIIQCVNCGNRIRVLRNGLLEPVTKNDKGFEDLHKWTMWEKELVEKEINAGDFRMELDADLFKVYDPLTFAKTGAGKVTITSTEVIYEGTDCDVKDGIPYKKGKPVKEARNKDLTPYSRNERKVFEIATMRGLVSKYGKCFEIYDSKGELFRFYVDGQKVYKVQLVVQLLGRSF